MVCVMKVCSGRMGCASSGGGRGVEGLESPNNNIGGGVQPLLTYQLYNYKCLLAGVPFTCTRSERYPFQLYQENYLILRSFTCLALSSLEMLR